MAVYQAVIWYEYDTQAPEDYRTEIEAGTAETAASRAARAARRVFRGRRPTSILIRIERAG